MAGSLIWTKTALKELSSIKKYLAKHASPEAATRVTRKITDATLRLEDFPESGHVVSQLNNRDYKEILVSNYRVVYRRTFGAIEVMRVVHVRRNLRGKAFKDLRKKPPRR